MLLNIRKSYKYRIYPTKSQETRILNQFSMCHHLYNWSLQERIDYYKSNNKSLSYCDQANKLKVLKQEKPWFKSVYAQTLQDVLRRLDKAYKNFFRRVKHGETPGFPKFKKKGQWNSITYPQYNHFPEKINSKFYIKCPKIGNIKIKYCRDIPNNAKI